MKVFPIDYWFDKPTKMKKKSWYYYLAPSGYWFILAQQIEMKMIN